MLRCLACLLIATSVWSADWKKAVLFRATFDASLDASIAKGDPKLYNAPSYQDLQPALAGLEGSGVEYAKGEGRKGDALRFPKKNTRAVFFKAGKNVSSTAGTVSFWLKLDPNQDLAPDYCDPLQITDRAYNDSAIWVDFTKDNPRQLRLGVFGALKAWNGTNPQPDRNPSFNTRLVSVKQPPFSRDRWTHIAITYQGLGSGRGAASLYLNGQLQGTMPPIEEIFGWDMDKATIRLGVNYIGLMDDVAVFNRPLTAKEVRDLSSGKW
ncbi:LamG domain-containing protein [Bryobacter aggregatus]|uniref:LamG domain-containing protein n=1 Tax=Bryobacter aggregatus TaxID=360054 RepID=UPI00068CB73E|nr:LamG domain-containing protein [Bryobacter aggregatus]